MALKVTGKQPNSRMCLVCGLRNDFSLKINFYGLDNRELPAVFIPLDEHQSFPGRLHGTIIPSVPDETLGRAIMMRSRVDVWS